MTVADGAEHALAARNRGECRGVLPDGLAGGGVHGAVRKMQGGPLPAVGQRGRVGRQLQRRHGGVALPDGGHQSHARPWLVFVAAPRQAALSPRRISTPVGVASPNWRAIDENTLHAQPARPTIRKKKMLQLYSSAVRTVRTRPAVGPYLRATPASVTVT